MLRSLRPLLVGLCFPLEEIVGDEGAVLGEARRWLVMASFRRDCDCDCDEFRPRAFGISRSAVLSEMICKIYSLGNKKEGSSCKKAIVKWEETFVVKTRRALGKESSWW